MSELNELYEVLEAEGKPGLLVTDHVFLPGRKFTKAEWKWGEKKLEDAVKQGRCKKIKKKEEKKEEKKADAKDDKKKLGIQRKIDNLAEKYKKLDPESDEANDIVKQIKALEVELS